MKTLDPSYEATPGIAAAHGSDGGVGGFAERIRLLIRSYGSVTYIARSCGFSEGVVRSWRDGRSDPSRERCLTLARCLGISLLWLVAGEGTMWAPGRASSEPAEVLAVIEATDDKTRKSMDTRRLTAAMRALRSVLDLAGAENDELTEHADLLAEYYALMGEADPLARAEKVTALHRQLAQRIRPLQRRA